MTVCKDDLCQQIRGRIQDGRLNGRILDCGQLEAHDDDICQLAYGLRAGIVMGPFSGLICSTSNEVSFRGGRVERTDLAVDGGRLPDGRLDTHAKLWSKLGVCRCATRTPVQVIPVCQVAQAA